MEKLLDSALVWFRRDLRSRDNAALYHALRSARRVWCAFVFDSVILDVLPRADRRVEFIHDTLLELDVCLQALKPEARLIVRHGAAVEELPRLARLLHVQAVYASHDDDPDALARDARVRGTLANAGIAFHTAKDHVVFERSELLAASGRAYSVFGPYKKAWLSKVDPFYLSAYPVHRHAESLAPLPDELTPGVPSLQSLGFERTNLHELKLGAGAHGAQTLLDDFLPRMARYDSARDFPSVKGPSYLSMHLRFGTVSIRSLAHEALTRSRQGSHGAAVWLSELIWRDFYHQVLHHHPHVVSASFKPACDSIEWEHGRHADALFAAWCDGRTGYPLVDAAMAQINQTGYMHNRLRMVAASFLVKHLGIDWRRGERYFALHLNDYDLAANNGGWQWAASTGCDAQPWFRMLNPVSQSEKFDGAGKFIRRYLPVLAALSEKSIHAPWTARPLELAEAGVVLGGNYPQPVVSHDAARARTLQRFGVVKKT